jgi:hypothetical protein
LNIHVYTDLPLLFGQASRVWMDVLLGAGHEVEFIDLGAGADAPLPEVGHCDVNLIVAGIFAFRRFKQQGLPRHGKHLLWMFDPLTRDEAASVHRHKTELFDALAPQLHAVMAMDGGIARYLNQHFPALATYRLPYLIAEKHLRAPRPDAARTRDVLMLGGDTPRRREAERLFLSAPAGMRQAEFIWGSLWGKERDERRAESRLCLNIHADTGHTYFDQFRAFEAWALGTPVVSEAFEDWDAFGIEPGVHMAIAELADLPLACADLLADAPRREAMARASQALLRERFSPAAWRSRMLAMLDSVA